MKDVKKNMELVHQENLVVFSGEYNYYKYANTIINILTQYHKLSIQTINKCLIYHWFDTLELQEKQTLIKELYYLKPKDQKLTGYEKHIQSYFDNKKYLISFQNQYAFTLAHKNVNTIYVYDESTREFRKATHSEKTEVDPLIESRLVVNTKSINAKLMGFMYEFKNNEIVFKIKDFTQLRNNMGAKASSADKKELILKLSSLNEGKDVYTETGVDKQAICIVMEILCRHLTETTDKVYLMDFEQAIENKVVKLKL